MLGGTFTIDQVNQVLNEAVMIGTIEWIFYESGQPFLFFPLLVEGIRRANAKGFKVGGCPAPTAPLRTMTPNSG
ncbi:MAG: hypothetical protein PVJ53_17420 [Desulfobacterales bacterium]|jgi:hypothetical protein